MARRQISPDQPPGRPKWLCAFGKRQEITRSTIKMPKKRVGLKYELYGTKCRFSRLVSWRSPPRRSPFGTIYCGLPFEKVWPFGGVSKEDSRMEPTSFGAYSTFILHQHDINAVPFVVSLIRTIDDLKTNSRCMFCLDWIPYKQANCAIKLTVLHARILKHTFGV